MAKLTRSGIAHDLTISPYKLVIEYENESLTYVFSSELYKNKFNEKINDNRFKISESLSKRFGFKIINEKLADIILYSKTETRGFLIIGKEDYKCLSTIELIGVNLIQQS